MKKAFSILLSVVILLGGLGINSAEAITKEEYYQRVVYRNNSSEIFKDVRDYNVKFKKDFGAIILVNEKSLASDGLSASGLVGVTNGMIVPVDLYKSASYLLKNELYKFENLPEKVYIIGGTNVINPVMDGEFREKGFTVKRIQGKNRIETSYNIAKEIKALKGGNVTEMAVTKAYNGEADAVSIASEAIRRKMPIILTNGSKLPKESPLGKEVKKIYAIGGPAVIKDSLIKQLKAERIGGKDRYETNAKVIERFGKHEGCTIVSGRNEDLGLSLYAATMDASKPIVMTKGTPGKQLNLINSAKTILFANKETNGMKAQVPFIIASYGKEVFDAYNKVQKLDIKKIGLRYGDYIIYTPEENYLNGTNINKKDYIIFTPCDYFEFGDKSGIKYNLLFSKKDKKIYVMPQGYDAPIDATHLLNK